VRVLHVFTRFLNGGSEANVRHFASWQRRAGFDVEFAVGAESLATIDRFVVHRVGHLVRHPDPVRDLTALHELRQLLAGNSFDVIHTHQAKAGLLARMAAGHGGPLRIHSFHGLSFGPAYGFSSPLFKHAERFAERWTDVFIAVGEELRQRHLEAGIGRKRLFDVIRSPIEIDELLLLRDLSMKERSGYRQRLGLSAAGQVILAIGALEGRKRPLELLGWLADGLRKTPDRTLLYVGEGPLKDEVQRRAEHEGLQSQVILAGQQRAADALGASDVLALSSVVEGSSQVVLQALAAGRPVVATDVCGLREVSMAPIWTVSASGRGFAHAVEATVAAPRASLVPAEALDPWRAQNVEDAIRDLHDQLGLKPGPT
jgi:glycosyltransferase involved in cell wall biosynthesis